MVPLYDTEYSILAPKKCCLLMNSSDEKRVTIRRLCRLSKQVKMSSIFILRVKGDSCDKTRNKFVIKVLIDNALILLAVFLALASTKLTTGIFKRLDH